MASFKSKVFNFLIRNGHLLRGKLRKETFDFNTSIPAFRLRCERGAERFGKIPKGITIKPCAIRGIYAEWLRPEGVNPNKVIMYVHGGGYVSGSCSDHRGIVSKLAKAAGVVTLLFEYRLAPEHPFPAAIDDSVTVYRWLLKLGFAPEQILIAGESAGGGLCLASLLAIKEQNLPQPVAAVAISPWTDLSCSSETYRTKNHVSPAPLNSWTIFSQYYAAGHDVQNPLISPLYGDLEGLPPLFISAGEDDELFGDSEKFYSKAKAAGVNITFRPSKDMIHCYPLLAPMFREATEAMDEIVDFIHQYLGQHQKITNY